MIRLLAGLRFEVSRACSPTRCWPLWLRPHCSRPTELIAGITTRACRSPHLQRSAPSVDGAEPAPAETQLQTCRRKHPYRCRRGTGLLESPARPETLPDAGFVPNPAVGAIPIPAARPAIATVPCPGDAAPERTQPKASPQSKPQQARRLPAKEATREGTPPRRPVQAATRPAQAAKPAAQAEKPNVYYERDSQLGLCASAHEADLQSGNGPDADAVLLSARGPRAVSGQASRLTLRRAIDSA